MKPTVQTKIKFTSFKVYGFNLSYSGEGEPSQNEDLSMEFELDSKFNADTKREFSILMTVKLSTKDKKFELILNSKSSFETDIEIDEAFLNETMVTINAPAIVFPFIRAYINTATSNAGFKPVILPAINFAQIKR